MEQLGYVEAPAQEAPAQEVNVPTQAEISMDAADDAMWSDYFGAA